MLVVLWIVFVVAICWFCPWWLSALIWIANLFIPDMVPFIDELLSLPGPIRQCVKAAKVARGAKHVKDKIDGND